MAGRTVFLHISCHINQTCQSTLQGVEWMYHVKTTDSGYDKISIEKNPISEHKDQTIA